MRKGAAWLALALMLFVGACQPQDDSADDALYADAPATEMVYVPVGDFTMGSDFSEDFFDGVPDEPFSDEQPERVTMLSAFWIDSHEVTNAQYRACVDAGDCLDPLSDGSYWIEHYYTDPQYDDFPVTSVTWAMGDNYCRWRDLRLPTEAEWEKAARGADDERAYPWGWQEPTCGLANVSIPRPDTDAADSDYEETCHGQPVRTATHEQSASPYGVTEMAGNVSEWTADYYADDYYDTNAWPGTNKNPQGPEQGERRVVRGGNFLATAFFARVSFRNAAPPDHFDATIGFRCARGDVP